MNLMARRRMMFQVEDEMRIVADPTLLASGTIAVEDVADGVTSFSGDSSGNNQVDYVDTGLTVGDLREWETFYFVLRNDDNGRYIGLRFGSGLTWPYSQTNGLSVFCQWMDTDKTLLDAWRGNYSNTGILYMTSSPVGSGGSLAPMGQNYSPKQILNLNLDNSTKVYAGIFNRNGKGDRSYKVEWRFDGITRKE